MRQVPSFGQNLSREKVVSGGGGGGGGLSFSIQDGLSSLRAPLLWSQHTWHIELKQHLESLPALGDKEPAEGGGREGRKRKEWFPLDVCFPDPRLHRRQQEFTSLMERHIPSERARIYAVPLISDVSRSCEGGAVGLTWWGVAQDWLRTPRPNKFCQLELAEKDHWKT